jgi:hypothetical protein
VDDISSWKLHRIDNIQWKVCSKYLFDYEKFKEWGNEMDYISEENIPENDFQRDRNLFFLKFSGYDTHEINGRKSDNYRNENEHLKTDVLMSHSNLFFIVNPKAGRDYMLGNINAFSGIMMRYLPGFMVHFTYQSILTLDQELNDEFRTIIYKRIRNYDDGGSGSKVESSSYVHVCCFHRNLFIIQHPLNRFAFTIEATNYQQYPIIQRNRRSADGRINETECSFVSYHHHYRMSYLFIHTSIKKLPLLLPQKAVWPFRMSPLIFPSKSLEPLGVEISSALINNNDGDYPQTTFLGSSALLFDDDGKVEEIEDSVLPSNIANNLLYDAVQDLEGQNSNRLDHTNDSNVDDSEVSKHSNGLLVFLQRKVSCQRCRKSMNEKRAYINGLICYVMTCPSLTSSS